MIPRDGVEIRFARSGGPGGQNVNKVATKAEVRFVVAAATWLAPEVARRIAQLERGRINARGELIVSSSRTRSQAQNLADCFEKLDAIVERARRPEKKRVATRPTRGSAERRLQGKKRRSARKRDRSGRGEGDSG
ncbi:MAG TPA: alternative ribosome rescue aminoacyl-tRNA hydrolase ArfB [Planctomycetota bacterium]|nr:alternative ribosome rescue aminoacyl-tRNA hydrolase ArfB [Planctomycetota bacterium]